MPLDPTAARVVVNNRLTRSRASLKCVFVFLTGTAHRFDHDMGCAQHKCCKNQSNSALSIKWFLFCFCFFIRGKLRKKVTVARMNKEERKAD